MDRFADKYTVYWEHPSQGEWPKEYQSQGYKGDSKQFARLGNAIKFIRKLRQDEETAHIDIKWISSIPGEEIEWNYPKQRPFTFVDGVEVIVEELPDWIMNGWKK